MKSVNKVMLLGNVTRDPELKAIGNGQSVCTFGLATNRVWKSAGGEKQSLSEYHNLVAWGGLADFCAENVRKGKPLYIEGYLKTRSWEGETGQKVYRTEVVMENIILLGPKDGTEGEILASENHSGTEEVPDLGHPEESYDDDPLPKSGEVDI